MRYSHIVDPKMAYANPGDPIMERGIHYMDISPVELEKFLDIRAIMVADYIAIKHETISDVYLVCKHKEEGWGFYSEEDHKKMLAEANLPIVLSSSYIDIGRTADTLESTLGHLKSDYKVKEVAKEAGKI